MSVSIKFDSGQGYQLEAIDAAVSLFEGWNSAPTGTEQFSDSEELFAETLFGNNWGVADEELLANIRKVQSRKRINSVGEQLLIVPEASHLTKEMVDFPRDFSVEMETGTGKTYVYLRTAIELYLKFGLSKFVIVVPTVAIREGVLASLELMKTHFREMYTGLQYDNYVYDSKYLGRLRQFATTKHLQILVMNIQSFNKDSRIIMRESDNLNGRRPIDFITSVKPVVIMDEPQKLDAKLQREAIAGLNPIFKLRYSATHKDPHCLIYRLGPVDAYEQRLVKRIEVLSMSSEEDHNIAYVEVRKITAAGGGEPTATVVLNKDAKRVNVTLRMGDSLVDKTGMQVYKGWDVENIKASDEFERGWVEFRNGRKVRVNESNDVDSDWWQRAQIAAAIEKHFETEWKLLQAAKAGEIETMKPLTLFFIDRVANYDPEDGKFKIWFDELYTEIAGSVRKFRNLDLPLAADARRGYFATTKGRAKDTNGDSKDDSDAYDLIMKEKSRLLSPDEPVRFIFSHSALSEGWDNPNVFTICNLQETQSEVKRRQQIGRGLRLPVMANGERCRIDRLNRLTVVASETFEKYAAGLQKEMHSETGESFAGAIVDSRKRQVVKLKDNFKDLPGFKELWGHIAPRTRYELDFQTQALIEEATLRLKKLGKDEPIRRPRIVTKRVELEMLAGKEITAGASSPEKYVTHEREVRVHDILGELQTQLPVSRSTVAKVINESGRLQEASINPAQFANQVKRVIKQALSQTIVRKKGIKYYPLVGEGSAYEASFADNESYADNIITVNKSIYDSVIVDSGVERDFAKDLDKRDDVELFIKLPDWFKISTPIGNYNPDWAIVRKLDTGEKKVYLVRETKGTTDIDALRFEGEAWKIEFGRQHFLAIEVDYKVASKANQLDVDIPFKLENDD